MKALRFRDGEPRIVNVPVPEPGPGEALLKVLCAGICGTDLEIAAGYMDFDGTPGHEFVGRVVRSPSPGWENLRVTADINLSCGACDTCRAGRSHHCPGRKVLGILGKDGVFAEYVTLPLDNLYPVPEPLTDERAVFAEPLAAALRILEQVRLDPTMKVLVMGDGRLGQLCARVMVHAGIRPVVQGRHGGKLALLARFGLDTVMVTAGRDRIFDVVVEATGNRNALDEALRQVRPRGTVVLKSTYHAAKEMNLSNLVIDEVHVVGSRCGSIASALERLASDPSITDGLITARYSLREAAAAIRHARLSDALKIVLEP